MEANWVQEIKYYFLNFLPFFFKEANPGYGRKTNQDFVTNFKWGWFSAV